jgi:transcriptional regulator with XRE-family HTH domain
MTAVNTQLAHVIGLNAKQFRIEAGLTLDQVSRAAQGRGLKWTESRVADFEKGRVASPSLNTLLAFVLALSDAGCPEATLPLLVKNITPMRINDSLELFDQEIGLLLAGKRVTRASNPDDVVAPSPWRRPQRDRKISSHFFRSMRHIARVSKAQGAAEVRVSKALNIEPHTLAELTAALWQRTFSEERDRRAGEGANAQKRGQITRALQSELENAIEEALNGNHQ